jgi:hypothetical protein
VLWGNMTFFLESVSAGISGNGCICACMPIDVNVKNIIVYNTAFIFVCYNNQCFGNVLFFALDAKREPV